MKTTVAKWAKKMGMMLPLSVLVACAATNIYFPEAAAEKAADKVIGKVWASQHTDHIEKADARGKK